MGQLHDGSDIDVELGLQHFVIGRPELPRRAEPRVVHQHLHTGPQSFGDGGAVSGLRQVGADHLDIGARLVAQLGGQPGQPVLVAGHQHQVVAVQRVSAGEALTEAGRRPGDQGDRAGHALDSTYR